jgi:hypothetical protein
MWWIDGVEVPFQPVEPVDPHLAECLQPRVELVKRCRRQSVMPLLGMDLHIDKTGVAKDTQVLGHQRLAHAGAVDERADGCLPIFEEIEEFPAARLGDDSEYGHATEYVQQDI